MNFYELVSATDIDIFIPNQKNLNDNKGSIRFIT